MAHRLPTELMERIFEFAASEDRSTAAKVSLVNRLAQKVAIPILYHEVGIFEYDPFSSTDWKVRNDLVATRLLKLSKLCRALWENQKLAQHVRVIKQRIDEASIETIMSDEDIAAARQNLTKPQSGPLHPYIAHILWLLDDQSEPGSEDFLLAYLFLACPSLNRLELVGDKSEFQSMRFLSGLLWEEFKDGFIKFPPFEEIRVSCTCAGGIDHHFVVQLMRRSSLKRLKIHGFVSQGWVGEWPPHPDWDHVGVEDLEFTGSELDWEEIDFFVGLCQDLKKLRLGWNPALNVFNRLGPTGWAKILRTLKDRRPDLQELHIDNPYPDPEVVLPHFKEQRNDVDIPYIGFLPEDLRGMLCLRKISCPKFVLFGNQPREDYEVVKRGLAYTFEGMLADSVQDVEIVCGDFEFTDDDRSLLSLPGTERLRNLTIFNCDRTKSMSLHDWGKS